jgi:hypothetical protein
MLSTGLSFADDREATRPIVNEAFRISGTALQMSGDSDLNCYSPLQFWSLSPSFSMNCGD